MSAKRPEDDNDRGLMPVWRLSSIGIEMGVAVLIGWLIGRTLDKWLGTDPWLMLVFVLFGVAAGFKGMVSAARNATADAKRKSERDAGRNGDPGSHS